MAALTGQRPPGARPYRQTHGEAHRSQVKHARELYASKEHTVADIVALLGIGWQTIYRAISPRKCLQVVIECDRAGSHWSPLRRDPAPASAHAVLTD